MQSADQIDQLLKGFLKTPPRRNGPEQVKTRLLQHIQIANNPEQYCTDESQPALAKRRRNAIQGIRRLAERYPDIAAQLLKELEQGAA